MDRDKDLLKWLWPFFLAFFVLNFTGLLAISYFGKDELHLYFNQHFHNRFWDMFFRYYTDLATTWVLIACLIYIILKKTWRHLSMLIGAALVSSIFGTIIKRSMFEHGHRPTYYFELKNITLRLVEGVESQIPYTFPSGHTVLATILCFYLCLQTRNRALQFLICVLMGLVAIGRVYLSKHFVIDTIGGGFLGLFFAILGYYFIWQNAHEKLDLKIINKK